jgi:hypothetical protein
MSRFCQCRLVASEMGGQKRRNTFSVGLTLIVFFGFPLLVLAAAMDGLGQTRTETDSTARIAQYCDPKQQSDGADAPKLYCLDQQEFGSLAIGNVQDSNDNCR